MKSYKHGRPFKRDWSSLSSQIGELIEQGNTVERIAQHFTMSHAGMTLVLRRLGLRTLGQAYLAQAREAA